MDKSSENSQTGKPEVIILSSPPFSIKCTRPRDWNPSKSNTFLVLEEKHDFSGTGLSWILKIKKVAPIMTHSVA